MILNWGGVGNVTYLGASGEIVAFDTGPANALIDDFLTSRRGLAFDETGMLGRSGRVDTAALATLISDPYFERPGEIARPQSFQRPCRLRREPERAAGAATLSAFTVKSTAAAVRLVPQAPARWLVGGGGRRNPNLMRRLSERLRLASNRSRRSASTATASKRSVLPISLCVRGARCRSRFRPRPAFRRR